MKVRQWRGATKDDIKNGIHPAWVEEVVSIPLPEKELAEIAEKAFCLGAVGMELTFQKDSELPKSINTNVFKIKIKQI